MHLEHVRIYFGACRRAGYRLVWKLAGTSARLKRGQISIKELSFSLFLSTFKRATHWNLHLPETMLSRISTLALLALPFLASASQCATGELQCCKRLLHWNNRISKALADLLGIDTSRGSSGVLCSTAADSCLEEVVCCIDSYINGHLQVGCTSPNATVTQA
ncbi:hypothetical protein SCLCIDRAFT_1209397 [Scleroderma citrinum Foug A]|uniref:Hydrophobin n=1 Tax=Scleroderma citrinum Foug A TaxID=1036808 RepID=A0A0C3AST9_9AGAM|nr:hypothetical protein SCLCIDRAFT_1209397 [Scleroderma citrinum Foug A]